MQSHLPGSSIHYGGAAFAATKHGDTVPNVKILEVFDLDFDVEDSASLDCLGGHVYDDDLGCDQPQRQAVGSVVHEAYGSDLRAVLIIEDKFH